jgi:hypothetical protein
MKNPQFTLTDNPCQLPAGTSKEISTYIMTGELVLQQNDVRYVLLLLKEANYFLLDEMVEVGTHEWLLKYLSDYTCIDFYLFADKFFIQPLKSLTMDYMKFRSSYLMDNDVFNKRWNSTLTRDQRSQLKDEVNRARERR